jgi:hypothetical protein
MRTALFAIVPIVLLVQPAALPKGITRVAGVDEGSGIAYVLISLEGKMVGDVAAPAPAPRLTGQCTRTRDGKLKFELLADLGGVPELTFYPPWKPTSSSEYPPRLLKTQVTMEFLGYTKVKPVKRQWEYLDQLPNEMRYGTPGMSSANMEQISFYMQYLKALPTLRLTVPGKGTAEWETSQWQRLFHVEPTCSNSGF